MVAADRVSSVGHTAYRLLVEGDLSVSSVAYRVGYSPPHFSVAFRKCFGVSPKTLKA